MSGTNGILKVGVFINIYVINRFSNSVYKLYGLLIYTNTGQVQGTRHPCLSIAACSVLSRYVVAFRQVLFLFVYNIVITCSKDSPCDNLLSLIYWYLKSHVWTEYEITYSTKNLAYLHISTSITTFSLHLSYLSFVYGLIVE